MKYLSLAAATLLLSGCAATHTDPAGSITKIESRTQAPEAVAQEVMSQLADALTLEPSYSNPRRPPTRPLTDLWFWARPQSADFSGLCEAVQVRVDFSPAGPDRGADTEVRASRIETRAFYRALTSPANIGTHEIAPSDEVACAQLEQNRDSFFEAEDATAARHALVLAEIVRQQADTLEVQCDEQASCASLLQTALSAPITQVRSCSRPAEDYCYVLYAASWAVTVEAAHVATPTIPLHWRIDRIHVAELIVLVHERID